MKWKHKSTGKVFATELEIVFADCQKIKSKQETKRMK